MLTGERIFGAVIMALCGFGCGALFCGIGSWAVKKNEPMGFWANGPQIKPDDIIDIPAYNRENARMWKRYSISYWLCGLFGFCMVWEEAFAIPALVMLFLACTVGIWWLVRTYKQIWKRYKSVESLDKIHFFC